MEIQSWPIERLVIYARNPRKNDAAAAWKKGIGSAVFQLPAQGNFKAGE